MSYVAEIYLDFRSTIHAALAPLDLQTITDTYNDERNGVKTNIAAVWERVNVKLGGNLGYPPWRVSTLHSRHSPSLTVSSPALSLRHKSLLV